MKGWIIGICKSILAFVFVFSLLFASINLDSKNLKSFDEIAIFIAIVISALSLSIFTWLLIKEPITTKKVLLNLFYALLMSAIALIAFAVLAGDREMPLNDQIKYGVFFLIAFIFISYLFVPTVDSSSDD